MSIEASGEAMTPQNAKQRAVELAWLREISDVVILTTK